MLMLIVVHINVVYDDCNISIHLMLMLILGVILLGSISAYFNTSHVNVNHGTVSKELGIL